MAAAWVWEDFFRLSASEEHQVKRQIAAYLKIKYTDVVNGAKPFAESVNGISPYSDTAMEQWYKDFQALKAEASPKDLAKIEEKKCMATVVNCCQVAWTSGTRPNIGYIKSWAETHLAHWDTGIERKAGGIDASLAWSSQRFVTTNTSSLWALISNVVLQFKTKGSIDAHLAEAFVRCRLLVYADATPDEMLVRPRTSQP
jgi:hypothetical protein